MNKEYKLSDLMKSHQEYIFQIQYHPDKNIITTNMRMPSNMLAYSLANALSDIDISEASLEIFLDDVKLEIRKIRKENKSGTKE